MVPTIQLFVWLILSAMLGLSGFWFFRGGATPWSTAALAASVMLYLAGMVASIYVSVRRHQVKQAP
jgi:F0F1-type ATP synthase membrane subunit a